MIGKEIRPQEVYQVAHDLFSQNPDWVTFFREVLGLEGIVKQAFRENADGLARFEQSEEYVRIQEMLKHLRGRGGVKLNADEPTRVITVRLPKSLHESLRAEAQDQRISMNKLCIAKLLQVVDVSEGIDGESSDEITISSQVEISESEIERISA